MVVVAHFDAPVGDRGAAEQQLAVSTTPPVAGAWHWVNDTHRALAVRSSITPRARGHRDAPDCNRPMTFTIGASHVSIADDTTKQVSVYDGGALVRTMPTSMGRGGTEKVGNTTMSFWTQPGVYTVMDKSNPVIMDSSTYRAAHQLPPRLQGVDPLRRARSAPMASTCTSSTPRCPSRATPTPVTAA